MNKTNLGFAIASLALAGLAPAQSLFVASNDNNTVLRYDTFAGGPPVALGASPLSAPTDMTFGPDGNLYVSSSGTNNVLKFNSLSGEFIGVFTSGGNLNEPKGLRFGPEGSLYVASSGNGRIERFNGVTGAFTDDFVSTGVTAPTAIIFGPDGNLLVTDPDNNNVRKYRGTDGLSLGIFVPAGRGGLCEPQGLTYGPDGNLYVASGGETSQGDPCGTTGTDAILRFNGATGQFIDPFVTSGTGGLTDPIGLAFGPDLTLFVASEDNDSVLRFDRSGAFLSTVAAGAPLSGPNFLLIRRYF